MESVLFSSNEGSGYIADNGEEINGLIKKVPVTIGGTTITPMDKTTLSDYFCREIEYLGLMQNNTTEMIFLIGNDSDLFNTKFYYQSVHRISETRIFEMYSHKGGRDHILVNGKWK